MTVSNHRFCRIAFINTFLKVVFSITTFFPNPKNIYIRKPTNTTMVLINTYIAIKICWFHITMNIECINDA